jgi:hypothetical protein
MTILLDPATGVPVNGVGGVTAHRLINVAECQKSL